MISERGENQRGVALLTVMIIALIMTILGIAAITVSGLETRMSGFVRTKEVVSTAAESCEGTAVNIIQQTLYYGLIQPAFLDNAATPGPIPASNSATVFSEISGQPLPSPPARCPIRSRRIITIARPRRRIWCSRTFRGIRSAEISIECIST